MTASPDLDKLNALILLAEKATPGEWYCYPDTLAGAVWVSAKLSPLLEPLHYLKEHLFRVRKDSQPEWFPGETASARDDRFWKQKQADAEFIAASRNSIPALRSLLSQHQRLRELATDWIRDAEHKKNCDFHYDTPGCVRSCSCGLSALRAELQQEEADHEPR